ncbi:MAG: hypothetical protein V1779_17685 [bacterium]
MKSATRIVLLLMVLSLVIFVGFSIQIPEIFNNALMMVLAFYFGQKINSQPNAQ